MPKPRRSISIDGDRLALGMGAVVYGLAAAALVVWVMTGGHPVLFAGAVYFLYRAVGSGRAAVTNEIGPAEQRDLDSSD